MSIKTLLMNGEFANFGDNSLLFIQKTANEVVVLTSSMTVKASADNPAILARDLMTESVNLKPGVLIQFGEQFGVTVYKVERCKTFLDAAGLPPRMPDQTDVPRDWVLVEGVTAAYFIPLVLVQIVGVISTIVYIITPRLTFVIDCDADNAAKVVASGAGDPLPVHYTEFPPVVYWDDLGRVHGQDLLVKLAPTESEWTAMRIIKDYRGNERHRRAKEIWSPEVQPMRRNISDVTR